MIFAKKNVGVKRLALAAFCCSLTSIGSAEEQSLDSVFGWTTRERVSVHLSTMLRQALEESVDIEVDRFDPLMAAARVRGAKGTFEPIWETSLNYQHRERLINEYDLNSLQLIRNVENNESQVSQLETRLQQLQAANTGDLSESESTQLNQAISSTNNSLQATQRLVNAFDPSSLRVREYEEEFRVFRSALTQQFPTGTKLELSVSEVRTEDSLTRTVDSTGRPVYPFYPAEEEAIGRVRLVQPLLRNFGFSANMVEIRIARAGKKAADAEFEASLQRKVTEIIGAYLNLIFAEGEVDAQREVMTYSRTLVENNSRRQKEGLIDIVEVRRAEAALAESEEQYLAAQNRALQQQNRLLRLTTKKLNLDAPILLVPVEGLDAPKLPKETYQEMVATALRERPEYASARFDVERDKARFAYARNQTLPQLDVIGSYALRGLDGSADDALSRAADGTHHEWFAGFQVSVPLGNSRALGNRDRARAQLEQTEAQVKQVEANISLQVINTLNNCRSGFAQIEKAKAGRRFAEETRHAETRRLEEGLTTTLSVLETQRDLRRALLRELAAQLEYQRALVLLDAAQGTLLEKHNINVEKQQPVKQQPPTKQPPQAAKQEPPAKQQPPKKK